MRNSHVVGESFPTSIAGLPRAVPSQAVALGDGDRFALNIAPVAKQIGEDSVRMLAYNGSVPGPTLWVRQGTQLLVDVANDGDLDATVHWHGLRLDNQYDGTPATQTPIPVGGSFTYRLTFPDPGVYWYHPHIREDYGQEMGLYGNIVVVPSAPDYWPRVNREFTVTLDDVLLEGGRIAAFSAMQPTFTAMGRFGNALLVNGEPRISLRANLGEVVRLYLTNTANTRVFNVAIHGARMKLVGGDSGRVERQTFVEHVVIAPSERVVLDVLFDQSGKAALEHRTPRRIYTLGAFDVSPEDARPSHASEFYHLRTDTDLAVARPQLEQYVDAAPDRILAFVAEMEMGDVSGSTSMYVCPMHPDVTREHPERCPRCGMKLVPAALVQDTAHHDHDHEINSHTRDIHDEADSAGIEWEDDMVATNRLTTPANMRWKLIDRVTGSEGAAIDWRFRVGDRVKIRLINELDSDHPMQHPFHVHGAGRFVVLSRDGIVESNRVWKDTVLVRTGQTVDILLDVTHPGVWMAHCHIAEHHESGMMLRFHVDSAAE